MVTLDSVGHLRQGKSCCHGVEDEIFQKFCKQGRLKDALHLVECMVQQTPIKEPPKGVYVSLLKECTKRKLLTEGKRVHALIVQCKCDSNIFLANNLIAMYSKCGRPMDARMVFNAMPQQNVVSWNAMIAGYAQNGLETEAIALYEQMKQDAVEANKITFVCVLKACANIGALQQGKQIHSLILQKCIHLDTKIQNTLINMYAKSGCLDYARKVFNNMNEHDVVSWNAMITGYAQNGHGREAIALYEQMKQKGMQADKITYARLLKVCADIGALQEGRQIHSLIVQTGIGLDIIIQNALVDMYAKCGCLDDARTLFNNMSERNVVSWTAMIAGYAQNGLGTEAIALYEQMKQDGVEANKVTFVCLLKACANIGALQQGKQIHSLIVQNGIHLNEIIQNTLVDMYAKCGCLDDARELFNNMTQRTVVSWTAMIAGYVQNGLGIEAITLYEQMKEEGVEANEITFVCVLNACANIGALEQGKEIHSLIMQKGLHRNTIIQNTLLDMYAKCGCLDDARELFNNMTKRNLVSWTAMISGYAQNGLGTEAIALYEQMKQEGVEANEITFVCVLKACANIGALEQGKQIHSLVVQKGFHLNMIVQSTLIDMYAKCGCLDDAHKLFNDMRERNVVSWTAMIAGYAQNGLGTEAIDLYEQMKQEGIQADKVTFICVLKACANIGALEQGKQIHSLIVQKGFHLDIILQSTLVDMYAKCGCLDDARELFNTMSERDVVSWNAMIAGYAQNGLGTEAIALYKQMKQEGMQADKVTFLCVLKACANIGALEQGKQIHSLVQKCFHLDMILESTLVDLYAKCGYLDNAHEVFNNMSERDVVSWNAIIAGYARNGLGTEAISLYEQMKQEGIQPDDVTFICIFSACSHSGLVKEGFCVFDFMCKYSVVIPTVEHYACMVDLLGRAGWFAEVKDLIMKMPIQPGPVVWMSLLGAARNAGNVEIGQYAFDYVVKLEPENAAPYLLLMDIYADVRQMDKVAEMRKEMKNKDLEKIPGCSWIETDNQVHAFVVGDETHPSSRHIQAELTRLLSVMKKAGYMADLVLSSVLEEGSDEEKGIALCKDSEMLAIAFGLLSKPPFVPIRIKKNNCVYPDSHNATKAISKIMGQEIYVIDASRLHHFKDGVCSCRDYC